MVSFLLIGGALFEALGFGLAVLEVFEQRRRVRSYSTREQVVELETAMEGESSFGVGALSGGSTPSLEERVTQLEAGIKDLRTDLDGRLKQLRTRIDQRISDAFGAADRARQREVKALGEVVTGGGNGRVLLANVLFIFGLALSTWGNLA